MTHCKVGSIIDCNRQSLGETITFPGLPSLNYRGNRVPAPRWRRLTIDVTGPTISSGIVEVKLEVTLAGRKFKYSYYPNPRITQVIDWDGLDVYGREVRGKQFYTYSISHAYEVVYSPPPQLPRIGSSGNLDFGPRTFGTPSGLTYPFPVEARTTYDLSNTYTGYLGSADLDDVGPGWTLENHHVYDPTEGVLHMGDGTDVGVKAGLGGAYILTGKGNLIPGPDPIPAKDARTGTVNGLTVGPDGAVYFADRSEILKLDRSGLIRTLTNSFDPSELDVAADGSVYYTELDGNVIRRWSPDGTDIRIAGTGVAGYSGDGGPATQAQLNGPNNAVLGPDGSLYIADRGNSRLRRVTPDGIIQTVAGTGLPTYNGDDLPALKCNISFNHIDVAADGTIYVADVFNRRIRKIDISGRVTTFAGNGTPGTLGDGGPALNAQVVADRVRVVNTKSGGTLVYLSDELNNTIRVIDEKGIINRVAGGGGTPPREGLLATFLDLHEPRGLGIDATGNVYVGAYLGPYVWKIQARFPDYSNKDILVPSPSGNEVFRFGPEGRHLKTYNAFTGKETLSFAYSPAGRLTHITDAFGNVTEIIRSIDGHPTALVNPYGQTLEISSDLDGNLLEVTLPSGASHAFTYNALGLMATYRTPGNHAYSFTYDDIGRLIRDDDPAGGHQTLARVDTTGGVMTTVVTSALGRTTIYRLLHGQNFTQTDLMVDPAGLPTAKFTTGAGVETTYHPDDTEVEVLLGPDPQLGYQGLRREEIRARTPDGLELSVSNQRTVVLADSLNPLSLRTYFESKYVNGLEYVTRYVDSLRMWTTQTPVGRVDTVLVDSLGRLVETRVPGRESRTYAYDSRGRLASVTQGQGDQARVTEFTYNTAGRLSTIEDAEGRVFQYTHDVDGRVIRETLPDGREVEYTHDADGNVASVAPPGRPTHFFDYNSLGLDSLYDPPALGAGNWTTSTGYNLDRHLLAINQPASRAIAYRYDAAGRLDSVILASGSYVLSFNATSGHLDSLASPQGVTTSYAHDGPLVTGVTWSGGVTGSLTVAYDDDFRPISQSVNGSAPIETAYDFDGLPTQVGGLTLARHPKNGRVLSTVLGTVVDSLTYSAFGDLGAYLAKSGSDTLFHAEYQRDKLGRIVQKTEKVQGVTKVHKYVYDPAGRLREAVLDGVDTVRYAYDSNGNRLARVHPLGVDSGRYDDQDRLLDYDGRQFTHNANGDLATMIQGADTTTYDYDAFGNLVAVELPDGTGIEYVIDGQNRRVGRKVNGVLRQGFLYQGQLEPIAELDSAGNIVARFIYASRSHVPDYMIKSGVTYRIISDHLGSPRLVVNASTGGVAQRIDYDEFGVVTYNSNPGFQPFGFAGGLMDPSTGLVRFGARDYDPYYSRWTTKDRIGFRGKSPNLYAYVENDPLNRIDPYGKGSLDAVDALSDIAGASSDFLENYYDMIKANTVGADKYFHCKANCEASSRGPAGEKTAEVISDGREWWDENSPFNPDPKLACDADRAANEKGQEGGRGGGESCSEVCSEYRPTGLGPQY